jgi:hypothetical protein
VRGGFANLCGVNRRRTAAVLAATLVWSTLTAAPALAALHRDDGDDPGKQISILKAILVFGVIPLGATAVIALLVMLPSLAKGPRYRPGLDWQATPEWYGAPGTESEVEAGDEGHASAVTAAVEREALSGTVLPSDAEAETGDGGGSSARW